MTVQLNAQQVRTRHRLAPKDGAVPTFLCRNRAELTAALAEVRTHLGITALELDDLAGFHLGYTGKLENPMTPQEPGKRPPGRCAMNSTFDLWLGALGVGLVVVSLNGSQKAPLAIAAVPPERRPKMNFKTARRIRRIFAAGQHTRADLAAKFGLPLRTIREILDGKILAKPVEHKAA